MYVMHITRVCVLICVRIGVPGVNKSKTVKCVVGVDV